MSWLTLEDDATAVTSSRGTRWESLTPITASRLSQHEILFQAISQTHTSQHEALAQRTRAPLTPWESMGTADSGDRPTAWEARSPVGSVSRTTQYEALVSFFKSRLSQYEVIADPTHRKVVPVITEAGAWCGGAQATQCWTGGAGRAQGHSGGAQAVGTS